MIRQIVSCEIRVDEAGDGHYGAPRGDRSHTGVDYVCIPDKPVLAAVSGVIEKLGFAYGDDLSWRIIDLRGKDGFLHRHFYVRPLVEVGDEVLSGYPIGVAQDITRRYPGRNMKPHVHYEIRDTDGEHVNPEIWRFGRAEMAS